MRPGGAGDGREGRPANRRLPRQSSCFGVATLSGWRTRAAALLAERAPAPLAPSTADKTVITATTHAEPALEQGFGSFGGFGEAVIDGYDFAERAAIIEEGANVPREWAEGFAKLEAMPPPAGVDPAQWAAVVNSASRFLDQWGAKAAAHGWTAGELFGLDPNAPLNRRDRRGAAFFLAKVEVVAVTAEAITLRDGRNVLRLYRRNGFDRPAWEDAQ